MHCEIGIVSIPAPPSVRDISVIITLFIYIFKLFIQKTPPFLPPHTQLFQEVPKPVRLLYSRWSYKDWQHCICICRQRNRTAVDLRYPRADPSPQEIHRYARIVQQNPQSLNRAGNSLTKISVSAVTSSLQEKKQTTKLFSSITHPF